MFKLKKNIDYTDKTQNSDYKIRCGKPIYKKSACKNGTHFYDTIIINFIKYMNLSHVKLMSRFSITNKV